MQSNSIIVVGGGDSYSNPNQFLLSLKNRPLFDTPEYQSGGSWKQWLQTAVSPYAYCAVPNMPNKHNAQYDEWLIWFRRHLAVAPLGPLVLVGHSLGAMFLAKFLITEQVEREVLALFLIAGPCGTYDDGTGNDCGSFQFAQRELPKLTNTVKNIVIFHSTDDAVVPYQHPLQYQQLLPAAQLRTFDNYGHFSTPEFPELLTEIKYYTQMR
jgi:predicted alpha/beta hydrolase family esterase